MGTCSNTPKSTITLAELARDIRNAQKTYFRDRTPQLLSVSKELERRLDQAVERILDQQKELFD